MKRVLTAILVAALLSGCSLFSHETPATPAPTPTPTLPEGFASVPIFGTVTLRVGQQESAQISLANLQGDIDAGPWVAAGWQIARQLDPQEEIPDDCALHPRQGIAHQLYARCQAGATFPLIEKGADFVYVLFVNNTNRVVARTIRTGRRYNVDTTGLIP